MQGNFIPKNLKLPEPKPAPKPRAKASSKASSSGEHVQLFRSAWYMIARRVSKETFVGFSCLIACRNLGMNLKIHVSNAFLCFNAFGNVGGG